MRAQKYLVLPDEEATEFGDLEAALVEELAPVNTLQAVLARRVAVAAWPLGRADRLAAGKGLGAQYPTTPAPPHPAATKAERLEVRRATSRGRGTSAALRRTRGWPGWRPPARARSCWRRTRHGAWASAPGTGSA